MNTSPGERKNDDRNVGGGDFAAGAAFDAAYVYDQLQQACRALEHVEEHAASAFVAQAMAMVHDRYGVGEDHRGEP